MRSCITVSLRRRRDRDRIDCKSVTFRAQYGCHLKAYIIKYSWFTKRLIGIY